MMERKIAYILSRFPSIPETFILREMIEMERRGWSIELYPLIHQRLRVQHPESEAWSRRMHRSSWLAVLGANLRLLLRQPALYIPTLGRVIVNNLPSYRFLIRAVYLFPIAVWMAESMQHNGVRHIHAHYATHPSLVAWVIHQLTGIRYSITVHAHDIFVDRTMLGPKIRDAAAVVAISNFNRTYLINFLGDWVAEKTHVIHCGIEASQYSYASRAAKPGRFEILNIGSLRTYKGQSTLIKACAILNQRGIAFRCRFVGGGELEGDLNAQIRQQGLQECVELLGEKTQHEVAALLSEVDCYVQPSIITAEGKMEGIPVALMEAMASGVPVIATAISGVPELVRPGETGLLVLPESATELADALEEVQEHVQDAARRAVEGRVLVLDEFDLRRNVMRMDALISGLA